MDDYFDNDHTCKAFALRMWSNWIETGDAMLSAQDAQQRGIKVKALSYDQMELVLKLHKLAVEEDNLAASH